MLHNPTLSLAVLLQRKIISWIHFFEGLSQIFFREKIHPSILLNTSQTLTLSVPGYILKWPKITEKIENPELRRLDGVSFRRKIERWKRYTHPFCPETMGKALILILSQFVIFRAQNQLTCPDIHSTIPALKSGYF